MCVPELPWLIAWFTENPTDEEQQQEVELLMKVNHDYETVMAVNIFNWDLSQRVVPGTVGFKRVKKLCVLICHSVDVDFSTGISPFSRGMWKQVIHGHNHEKKLTFSITVHDNNQIADSTHHLSSKTVLRTCGYRDVNQQRKRQHRVTLSDKGMWWAKRRFQAAGFKNSQAVNFSAPQPEQTTSCITGFVYA